MERKTNVKRHLRHTRKGKSVVRYHKRRVQGRKMHYGAMPVNYGARSPPNRRIKRLQERGMTKKELNEYTADIIYNTPTPVIQRWQADTDKLFYELREEKAKLGRDKKLWKDSPLSKGAGKTIVGYDSQGLPIEEEHESALNRLETSLQTNKKRLKQLTSQHRALKTKSQDTGLLKKSEGNIRSTIDAINQLEKEKRRISKEKSAFDKQNEFTGEKRLRYLSNILTKGSLFDRYRLALRKAAEVAPEIDKRQGVDFRTKTQARLDKGKPAMDLKTAISKNRFLQRQTEKLEALKEKEGKTLFKEVLTAQGKPIKKRIMNVAKPETAIADVGVVGGEKKGVRVTSLEQEEEAVKQKMKEKYGPKPKEGEKPLGWELRAIKSPSGAIQSRWVNIEAEKREKEEKSRPKKLYYPLQRPKTVPTAILKKKTDDLKERVEKRKKKWKFD